MKKILLLASCAMLCYAANAQYLVGFSLQGLKKKSLLTGQDTIIVPGLLFYEYQANTTSDMDHRYFCMIKNWQQNNAPDTLMTIDIATAGVTKDTISKGTFLYPEYHNEKMYGIGSGGLMVYDLVTHQASLVDAQVNSESVEHSSFNHSTNEYIFLKKGPNQSNFQDTICRYDITAGTLQKDIIPTVNNNFNYSEGSDNAYTVTVQNAVKGIYKYDYSNHTFTLGGALGSSGIMASVSTVDPVNNTYYIIQAGNQNARDTITSYTDGQTAVVKRDILKNSISNIEFFATLPPTNPVSASSLNSAETLSIYPNPATDKLNINSSYNKGTIRVLDLSGRTILETSLEAGHKELNIKELAAGTYTIMIESGGMYHSQNIIKK